MNNDDIVFPGELHHLTKKSSVAGRRGRIVRVVDEHHFRRAGHIGGDGVQVRQKPVLAKQRHDERFAVGKRGSGAVNRVARIGDKHDVAGIDERQRQMPHAFLGADESEHFRGRVEFHTACTLVVGGHALAETHHTGIRGILVIRGIIGRFGQTVDDVLRGGKIGIADSQVDDILSRPLGFLLHDVDSGEKVRGELGQAVRERDSDSHGKIPFVKKECQINELSEPVIRVIHVIKDDERLNFRNCLPASEGSPLNPPMGDLFVPTGRFFCIWGLLAVSYS